MDERRPLPPPPPPPPPPLEPEPEPEPEKHQGFLASGTGLMVVALVSLLAFQFVSLTISAAICAYDGLVLNPQKEACPQLPEQQKDAYNRTQELILSLLAGRGLMRP